MAIHIPRTSVQVQGMPAEKLIDTINNHKDVSVGHVKALWNALPESLRNAVANKVEGWGESISGDTQRAIDEGNYTADQIKTIKRVTPAERKFILGLSNKLDGFEGTPEEYLERVTRKPRGEPVSDEFQKAMLEFEYPSLVEKSKQILYPKNDMRLGSNDLNLQMLKMYEQLNNPNAEMGLNDDEVSEADRDKISYSHRKG